jgi:molybdate transport repressor ModE-like protein
MKLDWNDVALVLAIGRSGSLSGAARELGLNHSTVFRKLNALEDTTGVRFFERLPGGYVMTESGEATVRVAERIDNEMNALGREILGRDMRLQGKIRMTAPEGLAATLLPALLAEFHHENPGVTVDLFVSSSPLDLTRREADLALRVTRNPPDASLGRKICDFGNGFYASRTYLEQHGDRPLSEYAWVMSDGPVEYVIAAVWKNRADAEQRIVFSGSSIIASTQAARAGMGVVCLPCFLGDPDPALIRLPDAPGAMMSELWALTHPDLRNTARVKALMTYLYEALGRQRDLFRGSGTLRRS